MDDSQFLGLSLALCCVDGSKLLSWGCGCCFVGSIVLWFGIVTVLARFSVN
jgi:hypothetical protein